MGARMSLGVRLEFGTPILALTATPSNPHLQVALQPHTLKGGILQ